MTSEFTFSITARLLGFTERGIRVLTKCGPVTLALDRNAAPSDLVRTKRPPKPDDWLHIQGDIVPLGEKCIPHLKVRSIQEAR
jgi:hypothetical protein